MSINKVIYMDCAAYLEDYNVYPNVKFRDILFRWIKTPGFRVTTTMRICSALSGMSFPARFLYYIARLVYRHQQVKYGIQIGHKLKVGKGFRIDHYGGIVIGESTVIGDNCTILQNVTIGKNKGRNPKIGNNVRINAGAIIIGGITIGDNCIIGAGAVVTHSFPDNCVIAGVPAKLIKKI